MRHPVHHGTHLEPDESRQQDRQRMAARAVEALSSRPLLKARFELLLHLAFTLDEAECLRTESRRGLAIRGTADTDQVGDIEAVSTPKDELSMKDGEQLVQQAVGQVLDPGQT